jgi:hypothetical protein
MLVLDIPQFDIYLALTLNLPFYRSKGAMGRSICSTGGRLHLHVGGANRSLNCFFRARAHLFVAHFLGGYFPFFRYAIDNRDSLINLGEFLHVVRKVKSPIESPPLTNSPDNNPFVFAVLGKNAPKNIIRSFFFVTFLIYFYWAAPRKQVRPWPIGATSTVRRRPSVFPDGRRALLRDVRQEPGEHRLCVRLARASGRSSTGRRDGTSEGTEQEPTVQS